MKRIGSIFLLIPLGAAAFWSFRLGLADFAFRSGDVAGAMALVPENTTYLAQAALEADYDGRDSESLLKRVAELNPNSGAPRIRLGLAAEGRGDVAGAEQWLLDAYRVDRQFETRWTLANFYLRQDRADEFWRWMRSALEMSYGDLRPAFDLCWRMSDDPKVIQRSIPEGTRAAYLVYAMEKGHIDAIAGAAAGVQDKSLLHTATQLLLEAHRNGAAVAVWTQAGEAAPSGVTSPHFERASAGFGWQFDQGEGFSHQQLEVGRGHRVRLSGRQPESVRLLSQYVGGLLAGTRYRLDVKMENAPGGLEWRVEGRAVAGEFVSPGDVALLELWYVRPRGAVRAEAALDVTEVKVSALH